MQGGIYAISGVYQQRLFFRSFSTIFPTVDVFSPLVDDASLECRKATTRGE